MNTNLFFNLLKKILGVSLCVFMIACGSAFAYKYITPSLDNESDLVDRPVGGRINALLLATDKGGLLTDTIMLVSVDTKRAIVNVMSFPRDTRVTIGNTKNNKLNSVYVYAKEGHRVDAVIEKVKELTGIPINYYAVIHPDGFRNVIDILGGVYIDVPQRMKYTDPTQGLYIDLQPGYQLLDGDKAEQFTRFRSYPTGDLGRVKAQQAFITATFEQKLNPGLILKAGDIFAEVKKNLDTNFKMSDVGVLVNVLKTLNKDSIKTFEMPNTPQYINGVSYVICDVAATKELISTEFLGQTPQTTEK